MDLLTTIKSSDLWIFMDALNTYNGALIAILTIFVVIANALSALLTISLAKENRLIRMSSTDPEVVAFILPSKTSIHLANLIVQNIGKGTARSIRILLDADFDDFSQHKVSIKHATEWQKISLLPPSERIEFFFGSFIDLLQEPKLKPFKVIIEYRDSRNKKYRCNFQLDPSEYEGLMSVGRPAEQEIAEALKKIASSIGNWTSDSSRLKVETITIEEKEKRQEETIRRMEERARARNNASSS